MLFCGKELGAASLSEASLLAWKTASARSSVHFAGRKNNVLLYKLPFQVTPWPKEVDKHSSLRSVGQHLLLKAVSAAIITPFYSASLVETVQSDIASEKPGVLDVFRDGIIRLVSWSDPR